MVLTNACAAATPALIWAVVGSIILEPVAVGHPTRLG
jgi:hypothetical protein